MIDHEIEVEYSMEATRNVDIVHHGVRVRTMTVSAVILLLVGALLGVASKSFAGV